MLRSLKVYSASSSHVESMKWSCTVAHNRPGGEGLALESVEVIVKLLERLGGSPVDATASLFN